MSKLKYILLYSHTGFTYIVHIVTLLHAHQRITMAAQEICKSVAEQHIKSHDVDRSLLDGILSGNYSNNTLLYTHSAYIEHCL